MKDKSYRAYPLGGEWGAFMRWGRGRWTKATYRDYESCGDKFAREFVDLEISDFEPPVGTQRVEEFLDKLWGDAAPRTYNKNLSIVKSFMRFEVLRGKLHGDPALPLAPHKKRGVYREVLNDAQRKRILANGPAKRTFRRDRCALRLLLIYGIRKGALQNVQFKHFDQNRKRLTIFTKGGKVHELPIVEPEFWDDLAKLMLELDAQPSDHLMARHKTQITFRGYDAAGAAKNERVELYFPDKPMGAHGLHNWWYACLERADIVDRGVTSGERMHKARHSAGQRVLDQTGNLKAAQKLLGHASIQTTADVYTDWDVEQLAETMRGLEE